MTDRLKIYCDYGGNPTYLHVPESDHSHIFIDVLTEYRVEIMNRNYSTINLASGYRADVWRLISEGEYW